jgi:hypothetical protein
VDAPNGLDVPQWKCCKPLMGEVSTIGVDLAKSVFQVHGADVSGAVLFRKKLRRHQVLTFLAALRGGDGGLRQRRITGLARSADLVIWCG